MDKDYFDKRKLKLHTLVAAFGLTEGFWRIIKEEMYYISVFCNEDEMRQAIAEYIDYYNNYRYQERFNNLAPIEVRNVVLNS